MAAGTSASTGSDVYVFEKKPRIGLKLRITGKGRCNITNSMPLQEFIQQIHPDGRFLRQAFHQYFRDDTLDFFHSYGVQTTVERGGRIFPSSNNANDVVNALKKFATENGARIRTNFQVSNLILENRQINGVKLKDGTNHQADSVIIATGGASYISTGSTGDGFNLAMQVGHTITEIHPALIPLETAGDTAKQLQGLSLRNVHVSYWIDGKKCIEDFGEMLFTHFGVSGPIILRTSRDIVIALHAQKSVQMKIYLKPALDHKKLDNKLIRDFQEHHKLKFKNYLKYLLPQKMISVFLNTLQFDSELTCNHISAKQRKALRMLLKEFTLKITGNRPLAAAIVTAGGVSTKEINPKTMESKLIEGLYFAGEVIDVDADTGGFNLQAAFSTGHVAGKNAGS